MFDCYYCCCNCIDYKKGVILVATLDLIFAACFLLRFIFMVTSGDLIVFVLIFVSLMFAGFAFNAVLRQQRIRNLNGID